MTDQVTSSAAEWKSLGAKRPVSDAAAQLSCAWITGLNLPQWIDLANIVVDIPEKIQKMPLCLYFLT